MFTRWQPSVFRKALVVLLAAGGTLAWSPDEKMAAAQEVISPPGITTLANPQVAFRKSEKPYAVLQRGPIQAVVVDNSAVNDEVLPGHRAGYSGVARLTHRKQPRTLFVPAYAGLNFEHIHDGTHQSRDKLFEPRRAPMELRIIDPYTVELYQAPTPTWHLESATRYELLPDGTIQMTFECIPRKKVFRHGYIGLFWASYIHQPEQKEVHFLGVPVTEPHAPVRWIPGRTPRHGVWSSHLAREDHRRFAHDKDFSLPLVFNRSQYRYAEPWYYGRCRGMALLFVFRPRDQIRFAQSPSGGGRDNPAWDFQCFIHPYKVGQLYRLVMRAVYVPFESREQMHQLARRHLKEIQHAP